MPAIVVQVPGCDLMQPDDRERRDVARRGASRRSRGAEEWTLVEFRPARWLLAALTVSVLWLVGPRLGARALLPLAWRFAPRRLRLVAGVAAAVALLVLAGSVAALALALAQLA